MPIAAAPTTEPSPTGPEYASFLVRLWRDDTTDQEQLCNWLAQLEHIPSGEKHYFSSLEDLFTYMRSTYVITSK